MEYAYVDHPVIDSMREFMFVEVYLSIPSISGAYGDVVMGWI